jgi:hypothetical protein
MVGVLKLVIVVVIVMMAVMVMVVVVAAVTAIVVAVLVIAEFFVHYKLRQESVLQCRLATPAGKRGAGSTCCTQQ